MKRLFCLILIFVMAICGCQQTLEISGKDAIAVWDFGNKVATTETLQQVTEVSGVKILIAWDEVSSSIPNVNLEDLVRFAFALQNFITTQEAISLDGQSLTVRQPDYQHIILIVSRETGTITDNIGEFTTSAYDKNGKQQDTYTVINLVNQEKYPASPGGDPYEEAALKGIGLGACFAWTKGHVRAQDAVCNVLVKNAALAAVGVSKEDAKTILDAIGKTSVGGETYDVSYQFMPEIYNFMSERRDNSWWDTFVKEK